MALMVMSKKHHKKSLYYKTVDKVYKVLYQQFFYGLKEL